MIKICFYLILPESHFPLASLTFYLFTYIFYLLIFYKIVLEPEERERNADCSKDYLLGAFKVYANMKGKLLSIEEFKISQNSVVTIYEFPLKGPK